MCVCVFPEEGNELICLRCYQYVFLQWAGWGQNNEAVRRGVDSAEEESSTRETQAGSACLETQHRDI